VYDCIKASVGNGSVVEIPPPPVKNMHIQGAPKNNNLLEKILYFWNCNTANLVKKYYVSRDIKFFLGDYYFWCALYV